MSGSQSKWRVQRERCVDGCKESISNSQKWTTEAERGGGGETEDRRGKERRRDREREHNLPLQCCFNNSIMGVPSDKMVIGQNVL